MAKISTRPSIGTLEEEELITEMTSIITDTCGIDLDQLKSAFALDAKILDATDPFSLLEGIDHIVEAQFMAGEQLLSDLTDLASDNLVLNINLIAANNLLERICTISYDEPLDHATAGLMDALIQAGAAESTNDGDITFDSRIVMTKSDLKPILREAIMYWIQLKVS